MALPTAAVAFYREQRRLAGRLLAPAADLWGDRPPDDFDAWFTDHVDDMVGAVTAAQTEAISQALDYVPEVLAEQRAIVAPDVEVDPAALIGVAGDGRPLDSLLYGAVITTKAAIKNAPASLMLDGSSNPAIVREAWAESGRAALILRMQTVLADTSRVATGLGVAARPNTGYVRMLVGTSCSRCVVLAGRIYGSIDAFDRHPGCDCRHVPVSEDRPGDLRTDPREFFDSLPPAEQNAKFTNAGAQAIRDGADVAQVVNARRGAAGLEFAGRITDDERAAIRGRTGRGRLTPTLLPGNRMLPTTNEGTTRRGWAFKSMGERRSKRLMPEAVYQVADDREDALKLLRRFGYFI